MYLIQLRQIRQAISSGDLEGARALLEDEYIRQRKEGTDLLSDLADAYLRRARYAGEKGCFDDGIADCVKAGKCRQGCPNAAVLLAELQEKKLELVGKDQHKAQQAAQANGFLANGQLTMAMNVLDGDSGLPGGDLLRQQGAIRRMQIDDMAVKIGKAIEDNDLDYCLELLNDVSTGERLGESLAKLVRKVRELVFEQVKSDFATGRLTRLAVILEKSRNIAADSIEFAEWYDYIQQYRQAKLRVDSGDYRKALQLLNRLKAVAPQASWLNAAIDSLGRFADLYDQIHSGLPEIEQVAAEVCNKVKPAVADLKMQEPVYVGKSGQPMQINIDGVGSYMVFDADSVRIGPVSSAENKDIAIIASADSPLLEIHREEGDYFVRNVAGEIEVNGKKGREALLHSGDRIALSSRAVAKFLRPNPASETAVLDLASVRMPQSDIKGAVLAAGELILGNSAAAHIKCRGAKSDLVLTIDANGVFNYNSQQIEKERPVSQNGICFTIS